MDIWSSLCILGFISVELEQKIFATFSYGPMLN
jgi:hypothetical protein